MLVQNLLELAEVHWRHHSRLSLNRFDESREFDFPASVPTPLYSLEKARISARTDAHILLTIP
jgi:hypothetical protein